MTDLNGVRTRSNGEEKPRGPHASRMRRSILLSAALVIVLGVVGFVAINSNQSKKSLSGAVVTTVSTYTTVVTVAGSSQGSGMDQLDSPSGVAMDSLGNLYVADKENHRVQKCAVTDGTWACSTFAGSGQGPDANQFSYPSGIAVDASGNVYVADAGNNRVQIWVSGATEGVTITDGLNDPRGVAVDGSGNVYVADTYNNRVQKCVPSGITWTCSTVAGGNEAGASANQLFYPFGVAVDASGKVYVADTGNNRVQKWSL